MASESMSESDTAVIGECLRAAAEGPFFPDWEFHTLFGLGREKVAEIAAAWPEIDQDEPAVEVAVNNAMNHLLGYPHGREEEWGQFVSVDPAEVERVLEAWRRRRGRIGTSGERRYFDRMI